MNSISHENTYQLNLNAIRVKNEDSNGWKQITDVNTRNGHHVEYINDDGRIWAQQVHISHFLFVESQLRIARMKIVDEEASPTAADVGMEVAV